MYAIRSYYGIDPWFLGHIRALAQPAGESLEASVLRRLKQAGFSDRQLARRLGISEDEVRQSRKDLGVIASFKQVDTCAAEFEAQTAYCYGSYDEENEITPLPGKKVMIP